MSWFRVDDRLPTHRKTLSLRRGATRLQAIGAWVLAGAWSAGTETEGHIAQHVLEDLGIPTRTAHELVGAGFWKLCDTHPGCYAMHDYLEYNPSAEKEREKKAAAAERQRRARERVQAARLASANGHRP